MRAFVKKIRDYISFKKVFLRVRKPVERKRLTGFLVLCLCVILLLGLGLRLYRMNSKSFWYDESALSVYVAEHQLAELIVPEGFNHPGLFFVFLKIFMAVSSCPETWRILSVFFGVATIFILFQLSRFLFDSKTGLLASLLLALSSLHLFYSQEIGVYAMFAFFATWYIFDLLCLIARRRQTPWDYIRFTFLSLALLLSHYFSIIIIVLMTAYCALHYDRRNRIFIVGIAIIQSSLLLIVGGALMPFLEYFIKEGCLSIAWIQYVSLFEAFVALLTSFSYGGTHFGGADIFISLADYGIIPLLAVINLFLILVGMIVPMVKKEKREMRQRVVLVALWLFLPTILLIFISKIAFPLFVVRHVLFCLPAFCLLIAVGLRQIPFRIVRYIVLLALVFFNGLSLDFYYTHEMKTPWKEAVTYLKDKGLSSNNMLVCNPYYERVCIFLNYPNIEESFKYNRNYLRVISVNMLEKLLEYDKEGIYYISTKKLHQHQAPSVEYRKGDRIYFVQSRFAGTEPGIFEANSLLSWLKVRRAKNEEGIGSSYDPDKARAIITSACNIENEIIIDHTGEIHTLNQEQNEFVVTGLHIIVGVLR